MTPIRDFQKTYMVTQDSIREALKTVKYPGYSRDIVSFGLIKDIAVNGGAGDDARAAS